VPTSFVQLVGVEAQVVAFEPRVLQLAQVEYFGFVRYFRFEEVVEGRRNMILFPI
jgi:hypothetical protein